MKTKPSAGALLCVLLCLLPGHAQTPTRASAPATGNDPKDAVQLSAFVVESERDIGYFAKNTLAGTRSNERLVNIPQNIQVITRELMEDLATINPMEAMKFGASGINRRSGFSGDLYLRGFRVRNHMKDNIVNGGGNTLGRVPMYDIDRIEVVKGPSALLFGQASSTGGIINYVTKQPSERASSALKATVGSHDLYGFEANSTGPLGRLGNYRATAALYDGKGARKFEHTKDRFVSLGFSRNLSPTTILSAYASYNHIDEIQSALTVDSRGQLVDVPDDFSFYEPWVEYPHSSEYALVSLKTSITPTLQANVVLNYTREDSYGWPSIRLSPTNVVTGLTPRTLISTDTSPLGSGVSQNVLIDFLQTFSTGPFAHKLTFGGMLTHSEGASRVDSKRLPPINIHNPVYNTPKPVVAYGVVVPGEGTPAVTETKGNQNSYYIQDNVTTLSGKLILVGGLRWNRYDTITRDAVPRTTVAFDDSKMVGRWGAVYKPISSMSVYYNYSESFAFQTATFLGGPRSGQIFEPSVGKNHEVGVKAETSNGLLFGSISAFDVSLTNVAFTFVLPDGSSGRDQQGEEKNKGYEFDIGLNLQSPMGPLQAIATYYKGDIRNAVNQKPLGAVDDTWSLFAAQTVSHGPLQGLKIGGGLFRKGSVPFSAPAPIGVFRGPAYTTSSAFVTYIKGKYRLTLNVDNVADKKFIEGGENATWLIVNPGRTFKFSVEYRF